MSKFMERMRAALRGEPARMGFGSGARGSSKAPGIGLLAIATSEMASDAAAVADAVLLAAAPAVTLAGLWGVELTSDELPEGAEFGVVGVESDSRALRAASIARILRVPGDANDGLLRAVATLPVEGLMPDSVLEGTLRVADVLEHLRLGAIAGRPLFVRIGSNFERSQLVALRDAGIAAVVMDVRDAAGLDALRAARDEIAGFPHPPKKQQERGTFFAAVPAAAPVGPTPPDPDDEDDD